MDGSQIWQKFLKSGSYRRKLAKYEQLLLDDGNLPSTSYTVSENNGENDGTIDSSANDYKAASGTVALDLGFDDSDVLEVHGALEESFDYSPAGSSDSEQDCTDDNETLTTFIQKWSLEYNVSHSALKPLLNRLSTIDRCLPTDPRRLLKTPRKEPNLIQIGGGQYWHRGLGILFLY